ncbi:Hsp20/alpha crystallin family protein [Segetibacter aerophilus]|uniref:Heat-shock protein n=1 Tax=Segetibacter aerophilus TaxID=670293 RepID=A0A512B9S0_9BACT|nr:Hsp20/alpha crystallin family protein [Segetibacter aerophilus]GEO08567.1 heat-shock protein [Segetibacter aerophilus]
MTLAKRNGNLINSLPGLFDDFFTRDLFDWNNSNFSMAGTTVPAVNVKETAETFEVEMAAPGMKKEDFKVELNNNVLTISSELKHENQDKDGERWTRKEFSYQTFQRSFQLSREAVDADNIQAKYENGVLHLIIPKREEVKQKPARLINIS